MKKGSLQLGFPFLVVTFKLTFYQYTYFLNK